MDIRDGVVSEAGEPLQECLGMVGVMPPDQLPCILHHHELGTEEFDEVTAPSDLGVALAIYAMVSRLGPCEVGAWRTRAQDRQITRCEVVSRGRPDGHS